MSRRGNHSRPKGRLPDAAYLDRAVEPDYASVSVGAIAALALAVVGLVALLPINAALSPFPRSWFQIPLLIIIPLGTIPFAWAVMRSIRRSEGTKAGLVLARAALVLSVLGAVGSGAIHGMRQYREHRLLEALVADSNRYLEDILKGDYRSVFDEMTRNNPPPPGRLEELFEYWKKHLDDLLYKGGDYYGRNLSSSQRSPPTRPEDPPGGLGLVVYKFRFTEGSVGLRFEFRLDDDQWKLVMVRGERLFEFPEAGEKPKKRFE